MVRRTLEEPWIDGSGAVGRMEQSLDADLVAMVVRGSLDNAIVLWIVGILVGASVITLAAYCERHRKLMLQRLRLIASRLETWE